MDSRKTNDSIWTTRPSVLSACFPCSFGQGRHTVWFLKVISPSHIVQNKTASPIILPLLVQAHCITASPKCLGDRVGNATFVLRKSPVILVYSATSPGSESLLLSKNPVNHSNTRAKKRASGSVADITSTADIRYLICAQLPVTWLSPRPPPVYPTVHHLEQATPSYLTRNTVHYARAINFCPVAYLTSRADDERADVPTGRCISNGIICLLWVCKSPHQFER